MVRLWFQTRELAAATSFTTHLKYDGGDRTKPPRSSTVNRSIPLTLEMVQSPSNSRQGMPCSWVDTMGTRMSNVR